jgi:hypothetical protein
MTHRPRGFGLIIGDSYLPPSHAGLLASFLDIGRCKCAHR